MFQQKDIITKLKDLSINESNKIVVYTAVTDSYDRTWEPKIKSNNIDYYLFSDNINNIKSGLWNKVKIDFEYRDPRRLAKIFKVLPHYFFPNYEFSIWLDANMEITKNFEDLISTCLNENDNFISFFKHPKRSCIYDEAKHLLALGYGDEKIVLNQIAKYKKLNYPIKNGLIAGRFIIRKHNNEDCKELMKNWWMEIDANSSRDQLSFNFISWKLNYNYGVINFNHYNNDYFKIHPHPSLKFYDNNGQKIFKIRILKAMLFHYITSKNFYIKYLRKYYLLVKKILKK